MKSHFSAWILVLTLLLTLTACGTPAAQPAPEKETPAPAAAASDAPRDVAGAQDGAQREAATQDAESDKAGTVARILEMKGRPIEELIEWLGEPVSREYSSSCLVDGGQDGQLTYEGFTVFTLVQADGTETVYDCE